MISQYAPGTWSDVRVMGGLRIGALTPQLMPPIRVTESFTPLSVTRLSTQCDDTLGVVGSGASGGTGGVDLLGGIAMEGAAITLECAPGSGAISAIEFASFGTPLGQCGHFAVGKCAEDAKAKVEVEVEVEVETEIDVEVEVEVEVKVGVGLATQLALG